MPTYAYTCTQCHHSFDAVQSFADDALTVCPECGGVLRKQYGSIGVTFHGSGFYRTDSRSTSAATGSAPGGSSSSSASSKPDAKSSPASSGSS